MKNGKILLMGGIDNTHHKFTELMPIIQTMLEKSGFHVISSTDSDLFLQKNINEFDIIFCYTLGNKINIEQEKSLLNAIKGNPWDDSKKTKGFIGIHGAACSFLNSEAYIRMLGGRFLVHPPLDTFNCTVVYKTHPVMKEISDFSFKDELYLLEPYSPFETLISSNFGGFDRPIAWVKPYGLGKVFYISLGHGEEQLKDDIFQKILINAIDWIINS